MVEMPVFIMGIAGDQEGRGLSRVHEITVDISSHGSVFMWFCKKLQKFNIDV